MFKIGEFSRLTRVTVKALRYYDEIGLLAPSCVQAQTGYRYYLAEQLPRLNRILALKDLGFSLEAVAALLNEAVSPEEKTRLFREREAEIARAIAADQARLRHLEALRAAEQVAPFVTEYDVVLRAVAACPMATIRRHVSTLGPPVTELFERLESYVGARKARLAASPLLMFHDEEYRETDLEVEACVPVSQLIEGDAEIQVREVEGWQTMACVIYRGAYEQMRPVLQTLLAWTQRHGMRIAGPTREVYLRFGADQETYRLPSAFLTSNTTDFVTEVQLPVSRGESE
jgi:DNA-binding transcriptional MerR regulator